MSDALSFSRAFCRLVELSGGVGRVFGVGISLRQISFHCRSVMGPLHLSRRCRINLCSGGGYL